MSNVNASRPAETWAFEREAGLILQVFTAQIRAGAADGEGEALDAALAAMAAPSAGALEEAAAGGAAALASVERLSQRLHHVADGLDLLTALLRDQRETTDPAAWARLRSTIRAGYTLAAECEVFDAVAGQTS